MEGSVAAQAAPAGGAASDQGTQDGEGQVQQPDLNATLEQMNATIGTLAPQVQETREFMQTVQQREAAAATAQQQEADQQRQAEQRQADLGFLEDPALSPEDVGERLQQFMSQEATKVSQQMLEQQLKPLTDELTTLRAERDSDVLIGKYPELGDPETSKAVLAHVQNWAEAMGQPDLAGNSQFVEVVYLAGRAAEMQSKQEAGAANASGAATLEGAAGAGPAGAGQSAADATEAIRNAWSQQGDGLFKGW